MIAMAAVLMPLAAFAVKDADVAALEKYTAPQSVPESAGDIVFMPDGISMARLSADRKKIETVDIRSGNITGTLMDLSDTRETVLASVSGFTLSDDASKILVWTDTEPIYRRSFKASYYVYEVRTRLLRPLSKSFAMQRAPRFSPDARMVAFVAENNIYVAKLDYGTEVAVTTDGEPNRIINGVPDWTYEEEFSTDCSMAWAPDNATLCYLRYDEAAVSTYRLTQYDTSCGRSTGGFALYPSEFSYKYPVAGTPNSIVSLHSYDIETRKIKQIALPDSKIEYIPRIAFGPKPEQLMVSALNRDQNRFELYCANPRSTVVKSVYVDEAKAWISESIYTGLFFGQESFVVGSERSGYFHFYEYSYTGALLRQLDKGDFDATDFYGFDRAGSYYYQAAYPSPKDRTVWRVDRKGIKTAVGREKGTSSAVFNPAMDALVLTFSDIETPPSFSLCKTDGKVIRTLEDNSTYRARVERLKGHKEFFTFTTDGGVSLNGYMVKPRDFDPAVKYPVVMSQYSGPGSQSVLDRWTLDWEDYYASKGYVIICVDGRGTGGRGSEFKNIVYRRLGYYETIDQIAAARYAASLPYTDSSRIGIYGWSYGGYEALMCATADEKNVFAAAVAVAPVTDWRYYDTVYAERFMLTPQQNESGYDSSAPVARATRLNCPLLMMYGTSDDNVHPANTLNFVAELQGAGMMCDMFVFPGMNHSIYGCGTRAVVYARMLQFFDRNLK